MLIENHALDAHFLNRKGVGDAVVELVKYGGAVLLKAKDGVCSRCVPRVAASGGQCDM